MMSLSLPTSAFTTAEIVVVWLKATMSALFKPKLGREEVWHEGEGVKDSK